MQSAELKDSSLTYFPVQKLAYSQKGKAWRERCVDGVISIAYNYGRTRRSPQRFKRRNYNLFNNKIDRADFDYVLNPYNISKEKMREFNFPASLQPYDIISPYFHLLLGEESKRMFNPIVRAINDDALSEKEKMRKDTILNDLAELVADPNSEVTPEIVDKYLHYTPKMMRETVAEKFLSFYQRKKNLPKIFNDCFKDALLSGEEIACVEKVGDGVGVRRVNPLEIFFVLGNNKDDIDSAEKIYERNYLTVSEIIDEFYEYLTPDQLADLESIQQGSIPTNVYGPPILNIGEVDSIYTFEDDYGQRGIPVHRVRWISKKKMGIHHYESEDGLPLEELVDETFKVDTEDPTQWVEWFWINEYWEGVRIGVDMYLHPLIRPRKQQFRSMDNLATCKSGYVGTVYSATNSQSVSLMDRLVPWVYLYIITWYRVELAMAKNQGKIALIDVSLMPSNWDPEKWMHFAQVFGFAFVNSYNEENRAMGMPSGMNMSAQNKVLDLETSQYIVQHLQLLQHIDERIQNTAGITKQRLGSIDSRELVGNTERAVTQSSHLTEPYFFLHENFKVRVCETIIEVAKECYEDNPAMFQYVTDDLADVLFKIDGTEFANADYGVFVSNSSKDQLAFETTKQLLQAALQNDKIMLSDAINVLNGSSMADIAGKLKKAEVENMQRAQEAQQAQQQLDAQRLDFEREKLDRDDYNKEADRQTKIQVAEISALGFSEDKDLDNDGIPDIMEQAKLALDERKHLDDVSLKARELELKKAQMTSDKEQANADRKLKQEELKVKEKIEKIKARNKPKSSGK